MAGTATTPSVRTLAIASVALYIVYRLGASLTLAARRRALIREHGCEPPIDLDAMPARQKNSYRYWPWDRMFGLNIGNLKYVGQLVKEHRFYPARLEIWALTAPSKTCRSRMANVEWTMTNDVEIVKYVMSTDFDHWGFVPGREHGLGQFLGKGIFTTDGAAWAHSRALLKPNFTRFQVSNMALFERHFQELLAVIPRDGTTINLGPRFFSMTMDIATEFLFGTSSASQSGETSAEFADAFGYCQDYGLFLLRLGKLGRWLPYPKKFKKARKLVHDFVDGYVDDALEEKEKFGEVKQDTSEKGRYVVLHELVQQTSDRVQLRSESLATLLAGRDTTGEFSKT